MGAGPYFIELLDEATMKVVEIEVKGQPYAVPFEIWAAAVVTFDQHYKPGIDVRSLCRQIGDDLMPVTRHDPFGSERLARCLMSVKGRAGGLKTAANRQKTKTQRDLFQV